MPGASRYQKPIVPGFGWLQDKSLIALFGAILLSAVGSLPLHLIPLIFVTLIAEGRVSIPEAGWIASAILFGKLASSLALPIFKVSIVRTTLASGTALLMLVGLGITVEAHSLGLYLGWFLVGISSGILMYLGTVSAAHYSSTTFAFSLRLGIVLCLAGAIVVSLLIGQALVSYR